MDDFYYFIDMLKARSSKERQQLGQKRRLTRIVESALKNVIKKDASRHPKIFHHAYFGAMELDPKYLSIWYFFSKTNELKEAEVNGRIEEIRKLTLSELEAASYPVAALPEVSITFDSDEEVQRTAGGNYFEYMR